MRMSLCFSLPCKAHLIPGSQQRGAKGSGMNALPCSSDIYRAARGTQSLQWWHWSLQWCSTLSSRDAGPQMGCPHWKECRSCRIKQKPYKVWIFSSSHLSQIKPDLSVCGKEKEVALPRTANMRCSLWRGWAQVNYQLKISGLYQKHILTEQLWLAEL